MARHKGNNGIVKIGGTAVGEVLDFDIEETAADVDGSALNDEWDIDDNGSKSWSGNLTLRFNESDTAQAALRAGVAIAISVYTEGDASGKQFFSGSANIKSMGVSLARNAYVDKKISFKGNGALDTAVVV